MNRFLKKPQFFLWASVFLALSFLITYLLWPLDSEEFEISFDSKKVDFKKSFLEGIPSYASDSSRSPNIIIIYADDLGKTDISLYGSPHVSTPWIDSLGLKGLKFEEAYVTAAICSPSRAALLTGRYQQRFGYERQPQNQYLANRLQYYAVKYFIDTDFYVLSETERLASPRPEDMEKQGLPPSEITLADLLKARGYQTAIMGKWHLGNYEPFFPNQRGFDYQYGFYEAFSLFDDSTQTVNSPHDDFGDQYIWGRGRGGSCAIRRNNEVIEEDEYLTFAIAREAKEFMNKNKDEPFFLYLPFNAPHTPFQVPQEYYDQFSEEPDHNKRVYYGMIKAMDDAVGQIIQELRALGLEENTLICFASDNGGATYTKATDNSPLKGGKMSNFEGGINVPMMMYGPKWISQPREIPQPVTVMDFFETIRSLTGFSLPEDRKYDGINLLSLLDEESSENPHEAIYWRTDFNKAIRKEEWKLLINEFQGDTLLYNLSKDKEERNNVAPKYPQVIQELLKAYDNWEQELKPALWPRVMDIELEIRDTLHRFAM